MTTAIRTFMLTLLGALLAVATPALAGGRSDTAPNRPPTVQPNGPHATTPPPKRQSIPELDPAAAGAITAVLGAGTVLVVRRRKK